MLNRVSEAGRLGGNDLVLSVRKVTFNIVRGIHNNKIMVAAETGRCVTWLPDFMQIYADESTMKLGANGGISSSMRHSVCQSLSFLSMLINNKAPPCTPLDLM